MKITSGTLKSLIIVVIMSVLFFSMAPSLVHQFSLGVDDLLTEVQNTTLYGSGPAGIAGILDANWGYFLVVGVLTLVIGLVGSIFVMKRRGRR